MVPLSQLDIEPNGQLSHNGHYLATGSSVNDGEIADALFQTILDQPSVAPHMSVVEASRRMLRAIDGDEQ